MNITKKGALLIGTLGIVGGMAATVAMQTQATTSTTTAPTPSATTSSAVNRPHRHAPLGGDGNITAISGNTVTMQEEADEGGASYTVDASNAIVTNKGSTATLTNLKVGDKIFVHGTTNGTNIVATSISLGHPGHRGRGKPSGTTSGQ